MVAINNIDEFQNVLTIPFLFSNGGKRYKHAKLQIYNYVDGSSFNEDVNIVRWPDVEFANITFQQAYDYIDNGTVNRIKALLQIAFQQSKLYEDSVHHVQLRFIDTDAPEVTLKRLFTLPAVISGNANSLVNLNVQMAGTPVHTAQIVNEYHFNEKALVGFDSWTFTRCTFSDNVIHNITHADTTNYLKQALTVVNQEMTEIISFAIGRFATGPRKLLTYNFTNHSTIFKPTISITKSHVKITDGDATKNLPYALKITCPVWNGIRYIDYGYLFYKHGFKLSTIGAPARVKVSRKIGA